MASPALRRPAPAALAPSLARLQALNFTQSLADRDLDEQLHHAARIVGLPDDWHTLPRHARTHAFRRVVPARAEYVLRLLLQKLNDSGHVGVHTRASCTAWTLLDCTLHILPVSRCAPLLRDAHFPTILENSLHLTTPHPASSAHALRSPKRKRGDASAAPPRHPHVDPVALFAAIQTAVRSIRTKANSHQTNQERIQSEHMKMVLRTESAQAARILRNWLQALHTILSSAPHALQTWDTDPLSLIAHVWDLRAVDASDLEQFSTECLIPTLLLSQTLRQSASHDPDRSAHHLLILDRLITRHILVPSRAAFFQPSPNNSAAEQNEALPPQAHTLSVSIAPLSAKLLQAAQIQDAGEEMPAYFSPLFAAVPHLLRLVIRSSPARTPKARISEKPWIQASLVTLAQSVALVEIDSSIFLSDPKLAASSSEHKPNDLAAFIFEHISASEFESSGIDDDNDAMDIDDGVALCAPGIIFSRKHVIQRIIIPVMKAFSRNRQLLGFIERWDVELRRTAPTHRDLSIEVQPRIWDDHDLLRAFAGVFERSLTLSQISTLFQKHAERLENTKHLAKALSSAVIIQAMLHAIESEDTVDSLQETMLSVWKTYEKWVQNDGPGQAAALVTAWSSLSWLLKHLWPLQFHASAALRNEYVQFLLERASKDVVSARKEEPNRLLHSSCRAAAAAFVFVACDFLFILPDAAERVNKRLEKTLKAIAPGQLVPDDLYTTIGLFCVDYTRLLGLFSPKTAPKVLSRLWETITKFDNGLRDPLIETLSSSIFRRGSTHVSVAFASVLLDGLDHVEGRLRTNSISALLHVRSTSLPREQREAMLDKLLKLLSSFPNDPAPVLNIMMQLMEAPNATAELSSNGNAFFDIAQGLHSANMENSPAVDLLEILVQLTLGHLVPNKNQTQNKVFFEHYKKNLESALKKPQRCSPAILAVFTGTISAALEWKTLLPLTHYVDFLSHALHAWSSASEFVLRAYNKIPLTALHEHGVFDSSKTSLRDWISPNVSLESIENHHLDSVSIDTWPPLFSAIARYQLYSDKEWLLQVASRLLHAGVSKQGILQGLRTALMHLRNSEKMDLLDFCGTLANKSGAGVVYELLYVLVCSLDDEQEVDPGTKTRQMALMFNLCTRLGEAKDGLSFNFIIDSIDEIVRHKPNMTSQHNIESLLATLHKLSTRKSPQLRPAHASAIYTRLCELTRLLLLLQHCRSRLRGRFHLLMPLLSNLLLCLFIPNLNRGTALPPWLYSASDSTPIHLTHANAANYARLLTTLCSPTQASVQKTHSGTTLNDPIKAAREYTSQHVSTLLSAFCRYTLNGRLNAEVREKLMPGMWEVVSVAQLNKESVEAMFAGLGKSEQDVWRGVWGEWIRSNGNKERKDE
ncbi:hypothetical protein GRF29_28g1074746 [Pseudopithomyces chartarum]|uniref:Nucleolar 27S pre-rRNA processing Urb2/Npa2 C-terminal domain-containing protein n=1 Tax=Pseudopithomyces chartarum TaxID=1892770 RepID=A0AAN6M058_9PLEO|nr:hypothetical protein GRF29_28g1074746 [Pseudopithomyces chartarum]